MKLDWEAKTWGLEGIEEELNYIVELLNKKGLTVEEVEKLKENFVRIENYVEGLKEDAAGDDR